MAEPVLQKGSTNPAVRDLQEALQALGQNPGPTDGVFGEETKPPFGHFSRPRGSRLTELSARLRGETSTRPTRASPNSATAQLACQFGVFKAG